MLKTIDEVEGHVAELVEVKRGEEVLIAVDGEVQARMVPEKTPVLPQIPFDGEKWWEGLQVLHRKYPATGRPMQEIIDELREERS